MSKKQILFIPGLGSGKITQFQNWYVRRWANKSREVIVFDSRWHSDESYADKYSRLEDLFKKAEKSGGESHILAASAGGPLAVRLTAEHPSITSTKLVCGKNKGASGIGPSFQRRAPALLDAVRASEKVLTNSSEFDGKITVYIPYADEIVPLQDQTAGNAARKRVPMVGHITSIAVTVLFIFP